MNTRKSFLVTSALLIAGMLGGSPISAHNEHPPKEPCECEKDDCGVVALAGNFAIDPCRKLLTNFIDPVKPLEGEDCKFVEDTGVEAITCFSGNVGLGEERTLLTNRICPVQDATREDGCTFCNPDDHTCMEDQGGTLVLCGDKVIIEGRLCVSDFDFPDGGDGEIPDCIEKDVNIRPDFQLNTCRICPVGSDCREDANGCLELCGESILIQGRLLVNEFGPFNEDNCVTKDGVRTPAEPMHFRGDVVFDGDIMAGDINLSKVIADMQLEIAHLKALLDN